MARVPAKQGKKQAKARTFKAATLAASLLGYQVWGIELMSSYISPDVGYELSLGGIPLVESVMYDSHAPSPYDGTTTFREEV